MSHGVLSYVAAIAATSGLLSHVLVFMRRDLDSNSHQLLIVANLVVLLKPVALVIRGWSWFDAILISIVADICYTTALFASIALYRAFFHPLRNYPGPFWARISVFWKVKHFQQSGFKAFRVIDGLHKRYGNIVRVAPRQLSINEPEAYQMVYGAQSQCHRLRWLEDRPKNIQFLADVEEHSSRRKIWDHGLSAKACQSSHLSQMNDISQRLCTRLSISKGNPTVINDICHHFTFDVMGQIGFGQSYGQLESGKSHPAITKVERFMKAGVIVTQMMWVVTLLMVIPGLDDPMKDLKDWAKQLLDERANTRQLEEKGEDEKDLMSYVEESKKLTNTRHPMTDEVFAEDAVLLQVAGSDTSYSVLVNLCHYFANYPKLQEIIRKEVLATFPEDDTKGPVWSKLSSAKECPYLDATVNEVLRRHAPVPMGMLRESPDHAINIAGHVVPPKTIVSCPIWSLQYDERCFKDPDAFIPERWLDKSHPDSQAELVLDKRGFVPFSVGPMNCAGKYFAYMEIKIFCAYVLKSFTITFPEGKTGKSEEDLETKQARDKEHASGTEDYLTQGAPRTEVCFQPLAVQ
ncbi:hypothetical protein LTR51_001641 [Lithohypha guttulata]|uniref:Cytochrome P450 n=1 Tax=Lithohypha guttulata TaxID=1690604 RepID=A0AAN7T6L2_9EURO|nr:hypothetical protein LTR51_001641 [Lithohypha guttulata]KAK5090619.1 hypothetical protein LTR05_000794 [Lithohypha guttulata]